MSKPWRPEGGRTSWLRPEAYQTLDGRERRTLLEIRLLQRNGQSGRPRWTWLAIVVALALGGALGWRIDLTPSQRRTDTPSASIEWDDVQTPPTRALTADEIEWQRRGDDGAIALNAPGPAPATGARTPFGACKWGGGTNCVVDGDTIYLGGAKIRIAGIDAPETHDYRCASELALGERAAARLQQLVSSGAITLTSIERDRDVYGRALRNIAVDGRDVGDVLVSEGLARRYAGGRRSWC